MAESKRGASLRARRKSAPAAASWGVIELAPARVSDGSYLVRIGDERVKATLGTGVCAELARTCLRDGRLVLVVPGAHGPVIAGALQTQSHPATERGVLSVAVEHFRLRADKSMTLEVPLARLSLEQGGAIRLEGDKLVIDAAAMVRILSGRVEVP